MKKGFELTLGNRQLFYCTDRKNLTENVLFEFIDKIGELKSFTPEMIERFKSDKMTLKDLRYRISKATIEKRDTGKIVYYRIVGENFTECIPVNEADCLVIFSEV